MVSAEAPMGTSQRYPGKTWRCTVEFNHLAVSGLVCAAALFGKTKIFSLQVPIGWDFLILLPCMMDFSEMTRDEGDWTLGFLIIEQGLICS